VHTPGPAQRTASGPGAAGAWVARCCTTASLPWISGCMQHRTGARGGFTLCKPQQRQRQRLRALCWRARRCNAWRERSRGWSTSCRQAGWRSRPGMRYCSAVQPAACPGVCGRGADHGGNVRMCARMQGLQRHREPRSVAVWSCRILHSGSAACFSMHLLASARLAEPTGGGSCVRTGIVGPGSPLCRAQNMSKG